MQATRKKWDTVRIESKDFDKYRIEPNVAGSKQMSLRDALEGKADPCDIVGGSIIDVGRNARIGIASEMLLDEKTGSICGLEIEKFPATLRT